MKLVMSHDGKPYKGTPIQIVTRFKEQGDRWFTSRDLDHYMLQVASRLGAPADKCFPGKTLELRCQAFVDHLLNTGMAEIEDD